MGINVSVQYNGGLLPDIILLTQYVTTSHEEVLYLQPMMPPTNLNVLTFFPLTGGCSKDLGAF